MSGFAVHHLLSTPILGIRDVHCDGTCRHRSAEECASRTHLVFPYRGTYLRHVGRAQSVAEANQVLFFNAGEDYQVSHPVPGGDASLVLVPDAGLLGELAPRSLASEGSAIRFRRLGLGIDPQAQSALALLHQRLRQGAIESLEAESLALTLLRRSLGPRAAQSAGRSAGRQRLVDRAKLVLLSDLSRRWTLAEIATEVGTSPVYLTQLFRQLEGVPLYRYQLRLRLARALQMLPRSADLGALGLELGFSSHSHFSAAFRQAYGRTPLALRREMLGRRPAADR